MRAAIGPSMGQAMRVTPQHQRLIKHLHRVGRIAQRRTVQYRMPVRRRGIRRPRFSASLGRSLDF